MPFSSDAEIVLNALNACFHESVSAEKPVMHQAPRGGLINDSDPASSVKTGGENE
jgi:hypothetical protein